jgi:hypothetical protein
MTTEDRDSGLLAHMDATPPRGQDGTRWVRAAARRCLAWASTQMDQNGPFASIH